MTSLVDELAIELNGSPASRVDTGTLSLIIAVGVASLLTILITCTRSYSYIIIIINMIMIAGCVCAFRCCGNLTPDDDTKSVSQNESSFASANQVSERPARPVAPSHHHVGLKRFTTPIEHFRRSTSRSSLHAVARNGIIGDRHAGAKLANSGLSSIMMNGDDMSLA